MGAPSPMTATSGSRPQRTGTQGSTGLEACAICRALGDTIIKSILLEISVEVLRGKNVYILVGPQKMKTMIKTRKSKTWCDVKELISRSQKERENFILSQIEDYNPGRASLKAWELFHPLDINARLYKFLETEDCTSDDGLLTVYTIQISASPWPLTRSRRNVIF